MKTGMIFEPSAESLTAGIDIVAFNGWQNNLRFSNGTVELIITLDVGPRILSYKKSGGFNPLKIFEDQSGTVGEPVWRNRGGHRLWIAPEHKVQTYIPDNAPVAWEQLGELQVRLTPLPETSNGFQKQIDITLDPLVTGVTIVHRVIRLGATPAYLAPLSANLAYTYDLGDNAQNNLPVSLGPSYRSFEHQLVSLGLRYKF